MGRRFKTDVPPAFKLHVVYKRGRNSNIKSRDWNGEKFEPWIGLRDLKRNVIRKSDRIITATIYDKRGGKNDAYLRFTGGVWRKAEEKEMEEQK